MEALTLQRWQRHGRRARALPQPLRQAWVDDARKRGEWLAGQKLAAVLWRAQPPGLAPLSVAAPASPGWRDRVRAVLIDYSKTSTLHGICFVGNESAGLVERSMWAVAVFLSVIALSCLCWVHFEEYSQAPTDITTEYNDLPTFSFAFPAVTICPVMRVKTDVLLNALTEFAERWNGLDPAEAETIRINLSNGTHWLPLLLGFGHTLSNYQYPKYRLMGMGLSLIGSTLSSFDGFVISQVMMQGRLTCGDVLARCYWKGIAFSCCEQFQLQRTEMGYCMSFNSRTSTGPKILCPEKNCHHVWSTGPGTGLTIVFKHNVASPHLPDQRHAMPWRDLFYPLEQRLRDRSETKPGFRPLNTPYSVWESEDIFLVINSWLEMNNVLVMIHDRRMFPDINKAYSISTSQKNDFSVAVSYSGVKVSKGLEGLPIESRRCAFLGEIKLEMTQVYTQRECLAECRVRHISKKCHCRPYYIESFEGGFFDGIPECRLSQLPCVSGLDFVAINCSHCIPACAFDRFAIRINPSINVNARDMHLGTTLEISYDRFRTAVLYRRHLTVSDFDMLVAIGGFASLCLGCSILSSLDLLQMLLRVVQAALGHQVKLIYQRADNSEYQHDFKFQ